jgi:hypothetical protein
MSSDAGHFGGMAEVKELDNDAELRPIGSDIDRNVSTGHENYHSDEGEDDENNAPKSSPGAPFNVLMSQAAAMRDHSAAPFRRKFDGHPVWLRNSIFSKPEICALREAGASNPKVLLEAAQAAKREGNEYVQERPLSSSPINRFGSSSSSENRPLLDAPIEAALCYERALSFFHWLEPLDSEWRRKDIEDSKIKEHKSPLICCQEKEQEQERESHPISRWNDPNSSGSTSENDDGGKGETAHTGEEEEVKRSKPTQQNESEVRQGVKCLRLSLFLNLALVYRMQRQWKDSARACGAALALDANNAKAFYRRAQVS